MLNHPFCVIMGLALPSPRRTIAGDKSAIKDSIGGDVVLPSKGADVEAYLTHIHDDVYTVLGEGIFICKRARP